MWGHSFSANGSNGFGAEVKAVLAFEEQEIMAGRRENALLTQAIANNWSAKDLFRVARHRGKSWRFLSALGDKALEIEGYALLQFVADAVGRDFAEMVFRKSLLSLQRAKAIYQQSRAVNGDDLFVEQMYVELCEDLVCWTRESRQRYWDRLTRLLE
jgi:hypothetical protein